MDEPISQKTNPEVSDEQVEDCIRILIVCDCPVTTKTVFEAFKTWPPKLKEAVWRSLPQQWRDRLRLLASSA